MINKKEATKVVKDKGTNETLRTFKNIVQKSNESFLLHRDREIMKKKEIK